MLLSVKLHLKHLLCQYQPPQDAEAETWPPFYLQLFPCVPCARLADMGHSVVGVEIAEKAILQFYEDNNMSYAMEPVPSIPGAKVYKVRNRLTI